MHAKRIEPQQFTLTADEQWQFRRAQMVEEAFAKAVRRICEANDSIQACYLLDARKQESGDVKLLIGLSLDDENRYMGEVVAQFQEILRDFPAIACNTALMSAKCIEKAFVGAEFYSRNRRWG